MYDLACGVPICCSVSLPRWYVMDGKFANTIFLHPVGPVLIAIAAGGTWALGQNLTCVAGREEVRICSVAGEPRHLVVALGIDDWGHLPCKLQGPHLQPVWLRPGPFDPRDDLKPQPPLCCSRRTQLAELSQRPALDPADHKSLKPEAADLSLLDLC